MKRSGPYFETRRPKAIEFAWHKVQANGIGSKSEEIRSAVKAFRAHESHYINQISSELRRNKFVFMPAKGVTKKRKGKQPRPIVIAPIESRIVQRSILEVLQNQSDIKALIETPTSYGGIKNRATSTALRFAYRAIESGEVKYYAKTDIVDFFRGIQRSTVVDMIAQYLKDADFLALLKSAVATELENMEELKGQAELFPIHEIGVAQGCCLSPLFGNLLLHKFDKMMNANGVMCLRYIDDILILARRKQSAENAFIRARDYLKGLGFAIYDPFKSDDKGGFGETKSGFEFLGCNVRPGMISPEKSSKTRLLESLGEILSRGKRDKDGQRRQTIRERLYDANNVVHGWGEQYSFCNDNNSMRDLDLKISEMMRVALARFASRESFDRNHVDWRRALGIKLLLDCSSNPIIQSRKSNMPLKNVSAVVGELEPQGKLECEPVNALVEMNEAVIGRANRSPQDFV